VTTLLRSDDGATWVPLSVEQSGNQIAVPPLTRKIGLVKLVVTDGSRSSEAILRLRRRGSSGAWKVVAALVVVLLAGGGYVVRRRRSGAAR
jgi:hypothetical protein